MYTVLKIQSECLRDKVINKRGEWKICFINRNKNKSDKKIGKNLFLYIEHVLIVNNELFEQISRYSNATTEKCLIIDVDFSYNLSSHNNSIVLL